MSRKKPIALIPLELLQEFLSERPLCLVQDAARRRSTTFPNPRRCRCVPTKTDVALRRVGRALFHIVVRVVHVGQVANLFPETIRHIRWVVSVFPQPQQRALMNLGALVNVACAE